MMKSLVNGVSYILLGVSLGSFAFYGASWMGRSPGASSSGSDSGIATECPFVTLEPEKRRVVSARFVNPSGEAIRIVGGNGACNAHACAAVHDLPVTIPAGGEGAITVGVTAWAEPGSFRHVLTLYTDSPTHPHVNLTVEGRVTPPASSPAKPEPGSPKS